jgi:hypothetical protein
MRCSYCERAFCDGDVVDVTSSPNHIITLGVIEDSTMRISYGGSCTDKIVFKLSDVLSGDIGVFYKGGVYQFGGILKLKTNQEKFAKLRKSSLREV